MTILNSQGLPFEQKQGQPSAGAQLYEQSERARQYVAQNVQSYPFAAVFVAALIGYGVAYLIHAHGQSNGDVKKPTPDIAIT